MTDIVNEYFKRFYPPHELLAEAEPEMWPMGIVRRPVKGFSTIFPRIECNDGFTMSVQGHAGAYSTPRNDWEEEYTSVEVGFPSAREELLMPYVDDAEHPTETVYGYVPIDVVVSVIEKHGGIKN